METMAAGALLVTFWLHWVFSAALRLSLVAVRILFVMVILLPSADSRCAGSLVVLRARLLRVRGSFPDATCRWILATGPPGMSSNGSLRTKWVTQGVHPPEAHPGHTLFLGYVVGGGQDGLPSAKETQRKKRRKRGGGGGERQTDTEKISLTAEHT